MSTGAGARYTLVRKLGAGGMGDVWEATDTSLGRRVAVKTLKPELAIDPQMFARFRQEAEAAASLGHPNIIQVIELTTDDQPLLVMEMLDGQSLRDLIIAEGRLAQPRACFIALQILSALAAAHGARIVHRDIKPANVYVVKTLAVADFVKVLDFGIAKLLDRTLPDGSSPLTAWGDVLGTTAYMAPEQALGMPVDARADLFAVGAVLFEMLSGMRARAPGPGGKADVRTAAFTPCRKLVEAAPGIDPALAAVVDRSLALDPAHRFESAEAMVRALEPFRQEAGSDPRIDVMQTRRDAPPTMTAPPTMAAPPAMTAPATMTAPPTMAAPPAMTMRGPPRAMAPPAKGVPAWVWMLVGIPVGVITILGALLALYLWVDHRISRELNSDSKTFLGSYRAPRCVPPSECTSVAQANESFVVDGVHYSACQRLDRKRETRYGVGDYVWVETGLAAAVGKIVRVPNDGEYEIAFPSGRESTFTQDSIIGRICR